MSKLDNLLSRLSKVKRTGKDSYVACCPAHQDKSPSMTIREIEQDHILIHCFAGCDVDSVLGAVGLEFDDVFPDRAKDEYRKPSPIPFNSRDVLASLVNDATLLFVTISDVRKGVTVPDADLDAAYKAACRIVAGARLGGVS